MPEPVAPSTADDELRAHVEQALSATYEVEQEIGRGGMGIVYRARDKRLKRKVAIKLLPPELSFRRDIRSRFLREAETAAQLSHPNIVPIYSVDETANLVYFVMACIEGDNLAKLVQKRGPLPIDDTRRWLTEVADALAYAHARGVVHRDIKPDNILLDGIDGRALVTDFGIARAAVDSGEASRLTATGMAIGTPAYMSPEQASGDRDLDARSDLYSLGIVAYQMLVGEPPFVANTTPAYLLKHLAEIPVPVQDRRADVPPDLSRIVMRLLEKNPEQRFQNGTELVTALRSGYVPPTPMPFMPSPSGGGASRLTFDGAPIGGMRLPSAGGTAGAAPAAPGQLAASAPANAARGAAAPYQQNTQYAPLAGASAGGGRITSVDPVSTYGAGSSSHSLDEVARWESEPVAKFRKKLAFYLTVNVAILVLAPFTGGDFLGITGVWTILMAWWYAKLWSHQNQYDWHDVLRQPRHRMLGEVVSDVGDNIQSVFSAKKREQLRAEGRENSLRGVLSSAPTGSVPGVGRAGVGVAGARVDVEFKYPSTLPPSSAGASANVGGYRGGVMGAPFGRVPDELLGEYLPLVQRARADRDEVQRLLATLPQSERARIPTVAATTSELVAKVEAIAADLASGDRELGGDRGPAVDAEIGALEAQANPLDESGSESRVRRLAQLRRDKRAILEHTKKRDTRRAQLDSCVLALETVRVDLVKLRTGGSTVQSVTQIAHDAMQLARDVDIAVAAATETREAMRGSNSRAQPA